MSAHAATTDTTLADPANQTGNVPVPLASILGRDADIETIVDRLDDLDARLLTLVGPGGVGKTRLAQEVARRTQDRFAHGAWFVPFAAVLDHEQIPAAIAHALQIEIPTGTDALHQVIQHLERRHLLLVLDNLEHLAQDAAEPVAALARGCPRVKLLVTSRVALHISGEVLYEVPPLPVPSNVSGQVDAAGPAVALFIRHARTKRPNFLPDSATVDTIAHICRTVDGLPLAIEMAASRIGVLSPPAILERLDRRLAILVRHPRGVPARHSSLRTTIAWSYDLLPEPAQRLFRRLSVYVGGFGIEAISSSGGGSPFSDEDLRHFAALVDHHLVRPTEDDEDRFTMLETIREFGLEALADCGENEPGFDSHAAYFRNLAMRFGPEAAGPRTPQVVPALRAEWSNIRLAAEWLAKRGRVDDAIAMYSAMYTFLLREDHEEEARDAFETWLLDPHLGDQARAIALLRSGCLSNFLAERERTVPRIAEAIDLFRANGDNSHLAIALVLGIPEPRSAEEFAQGVTRCHEGLTLARQLGDPFIALNALQYLAWASAVDGNLDEACALARQQVDIARDSGMELSEANALSLLADLLMDKGDLDEAEALFETAASVYERQGMWMYHIEVQRASLAMERGNLVAARTRLETAVAIARERSLAREMAPLLLLLAKVNLKERQFANALDLARDALLAFHQTSSSGAMAECLDIIARVAVHAGDARNAAVLLGASEAILRAHSIGEDCDANDRDHVETAEMARHMLGSESYKSAVVSGESQTLDEVLNAARSWRIPDHRGEHDPMPATVDRKGISNREMEVLRLMSDGLGNAEIARSLGLSPHTVTVHVSHILTRLDLGSRTAAVAWAIRNGFA